MDDHTLRVVEYDKVRQMLADCASSEPGKARARNLRPNTDRGWVQTRLEETTEMSRLLQSDRRPPLQGLKNMEPLLSRAKSRGVLEPDQLNEIAQLLRCASEVEQFLQHRSETVPRLAGIADRLHIHDNVEDDIHNCIDEDHNVRDDASPELKRLNNEAERLLQQIRGRMQTIMSEQQQRDILQDSTIVQRSGRYCLAVKIEDKGRFDGIVHGRSDSGATVFMEPADVVPMGNDLRETRLAIEAEIKRILKELTSEIIAIADGISENVRTLSIVDFIVAKARLAGKMDAAEPQLTSGQRLKLKAARHPFIPDDEVVPIDIRIGEDFRTLVITGPNTGGKTVALKTVGLLTLMTLSGLHIPASPASQITVWQHLFADIGDEQSIEQSLSTFSGHITQIIKIVNRLHAYQRQSDDDAGDSEASKTLVLLDELGAGTDPTEGAALACSLLVELHGSGCRTMATTHHNDLKAFAYASDGMENASVEFDAKTLQPLYSVSIGQPGSSNAFEIAGRLGLPATIVNRAHEFLSGERQQFQKAVSEVQTQRRQLRERTERIAKKEREISEMKQKYENMLQQLRERRQKAIEEGFEEAREIVERADENAREIIAKMQSQESQSEVTGQAREELTELKQEVVQEQREAQQAEQEAKQEEDEEAEKETPDEVLMYDAVYVPALDQDGVVVDIPRENVAEVRVGSMHTEVQFDDLRPPKDGSQTQGATIAERMRARKSMSVDNEIDIRGQTVDEAILELEKYIDDAQLARLEMVRIIHGKGTGALRKGVREFLEDQPNVRKIETADRQDGGQGATEVFF